MPLETHILSSNWKISVQKLYFPCSNNYRRRHKSRTRYVSLRNLVPFRDISHCDVSCSRTSHPRPILSHYHWFYLYRDKVSRPRGKMATIIERLCRIVNLHCVYRRKLPQQENNSIISYVRWRLLLVCGMNNGKLHVFHLFLSAGSLEGFHIQINGNSCFLRAANLIYTLLFTPFPWLFVIFLTFKRN